NEINANALRPDQAHDLLDLVQQRFGRIGEQKMRLVEEEHELRLGGIADFGKLLEQLRQKPEEKRGVEPRALHELVRGEDVYETASVRVGADEVLELEGGLGEEFLAALILQHQQLSLDRPDGGLRHVAILRRQLRRML